jgi:type IV secretion system protein VirD4
MLRELLCQPERMDLAIKLMCSSDAWDGMLARMGGQLLHFVERERASTLTTVSRHLRNLDTPAIAASTSASSFDPKELRKGKMSAYLILPPDHMRAQAPLLRLWITALLRAVVKGGLQESNKVHVILDEAASLEHLTAIDELVDKYRGYGLRGQFYYQSIGQLKQCFPNGQDQTFLSNVTQCFFAVNDNATADYVSTRLGDATVIAESGGTSTGHTVQRSTGMQQQGSRSVSHTKSSNWQQHARKLLTAAEVTTLPQRTAITFVPGMAPTWTTLIRYFEEKQFTKPAGRMKQRLVACFTLIASAALCAACVGAAIALTVVALQAR